MSNVSIRFEEAENGCMEETKYSIANRIEEAWGFHYSDILLMESTMTAPMVIGGRSYYACADIQFTVHGRGWTTDFETIERAPQFDDDEDEEA